MSRILMIFMSIAVFTLSGHAKSPSTDGTDILQQADRQSSQPGVSPVRRIERQRSSANRPGPNLPGYPGIDGSANNLDDPLMGSAGTALLRLVPAAYADGISALAGTSRPGARVVSNGVSAQLEDRPNAVQASDYLWLWGQFLDHDIDLTDGVEPSEHADIPVPAGDQYFDPDGSGDDTILFNRSLYDPATGTSVANPRQQINEITAWIDASNVYGSDYERAEALRMLDGSGRMKTSAGDLLPFNTEGLANAGGPSDALFLAGDVRANEHVGLTAMHTLFVREHNRLADEIRTNEPQLSGDEIYERARQWVRAEIQAISYNEFLPLLLGRNALGDYRRYDPSVDASIANLFSSASYRFGHSALSSQLRRLDAAGETIVEGDLALREAFFAPHRITGEGGIEPLLRGFATQRCQAIDVFVIDDVRNFLFGDPGDDGFDLVSLNIQRGRDHGLPSYNDVRESLGLSRKAGFAEVSSDATVVARLQSTYDTVDGIDVWVGGLAEDRVAGAMVGELIHAVLTEQFYALRAGDRFWYERSLPSDQVDAINATRLSDVIRRNTAVGNEIQHDVFRTRQSGPRRDGPRPRRNPGER